MTVLPDRVSSAGWTPTPLKALSLDFRGLAPTLLKVARRLVTREDAEDLVQDVLLSYIRKVADGRVDSEETRRTMLLGMLRHAALERRQVGRRRRKLEAFITGSTLVGRPPRGADLVVEAGYLEKRIDEAIARLPRRWRESFLLVYEDGIGVEETAEVLGVSRSTARANYARACLMLRRHLVNAGVDASMLRGGGHEAA
jgi:RNA polymerase sigma-70 factor (ECF subfamily)